MQVITVPVQGAGLAEKAAECQACGYRFHPLQVSGPDQVRRRYNQHYEHRHA